MCIVFTYLFSRFPVQWQWKILYLKICQNSIRNINSCKFKRKDVRKTKYKLHVRAISNLSTLRHFNWFPIIFFLILPLLNLFICWFFHCWRNLFWYISLSCIHYQRLARHSSTNNQDDYQYKPIIRSIATLTFNNSWINCLVRYFFQFLNMYTYSTIDGILHLYEF